MFEYLTRIGNSFSQFMNVVFWLGHADAVTSQSLIDGESVTLRVLLASGDTVTVDVTMQGQAVKTQHVSGDLSASVSIIQGRFFIGGHEIFFSVVNIIASDSEHTILVSY